MNAFESIVSTIFETKGYWVKTNYKVELTKEEKRRIGRPSSPRWEIDVIAYKGGTNELLVIECKSYLDSEGVKVRDLKGGKYAERYKLFTDEILQKIVLSRLITQLIKSGLCPENTSLTLCLAAGKIATDQDQKDLKLYFEEKGWELFAPDWIKGELIKLSNSGYENDISIVMTKLLTRA